MKNIQRLAIANRGEIALRIIRACQEMGIESILLHSEADIHSIAYRIADHRLCIGPSPIEDSYLNIENTIEGALSAQADAIHPGFGFLSENADFAQACADRQLIFVGPSPRSIRLFGDKISAKQLVTEVGVPCLPGYSGEDQSLETLAKEAEKLGYPLMVKAAGGGGGRGLKIIHKASQAEEAIESAQREGLSAFGSRQVFLEKYLDQAKHIEFQIFGEDSGQIYNLLDRECSVQRRHQKLIEEALSPSLDFQLRQQMGEAAVRIAQAAEYKGAGTIEFLLQEGHFYFLEMNTRLQVEHPVTELVLGVDLVQAQILTAQGKSLMWRPEELHPWSHSLSGSNNSKEPIPKSLSSKSLSPKSLSSKSLSSKKIPSPQEILKGHTLKGQALKDQALKGQALKGQALKGHAIECRIYTEDPYREGRPSTGILGSCHWPQGPGRRFELGFESGDEITTFYDCMIAKVVVWAETRVRAIRRMRRTLADTVIFGLQTNIPQLQEILSHPEFVSGTMTTRFIEEHFPNGLQGGELSETEKEVAQLAASHLSSPFSARGSLDPSLSTNPNEMSPSPWMISSESSESSEKL